jgi:Ca2+-binding EF-hand superfamily protein
VGLRELRKISKELGELTDDSFLQEMIARGDTDGDDMISEEEFYNLMTKKTG